MRKIHKNIRQQRGKLFRQKKGAKFRTVTMLVEHRHVNFGILPRVKTARLRPDPYMEEQISSDTLRLMRSQAKSLTGSARGSVTLLMEWYLKILIRESLFNVKKEKWDQNAPSNSPKALGTKKNRERKGLSRRIIQKCEPHERGPCAPKFGERSHEETLHQERCARKAAWDLGKTFTTKLRLIFLVKKR